jgi:DnaK suppressor protein
MTPSDKKKLHEQLLDLQRQLVDIADSTQDSGKTVMLDQSAVGRLSRMDAMQQQQMALETERRRLLQLVAIERALLRIKSDEFGECFECGEAIDVRRLAFDPTCTRCIQCAEV